MSILKERIKQEDKFSYKNKFKNQQLTFSPTGEEIVATYNAEEISNLAQTKNKDAQLTHSNPNRQFAVLKVAPKATLDAASKTLSALTGVVNTIPVLKDAEGATRYFMPDELTIQFNDGISDKDAEQIIEKLGSKIVVKQRTEGYYTVTVPAGKGLFETLELLAGKNEVKFAEPSEFGLNDQCTRHSDTVQEGIQAPSTVNPEELKRYLADRKDDGSALQERQLNSDIEAYLPNDTDFSRLWGLRNVGQVVNGVAGTAGADIKATPAWDYTLGHPEVILAIIDTGCDLNHPDLQANLLPRGAEDWDFADAGDSVPEDADGHGTHVAGTTAAVDNAIGVIGVAPKCRIMPLRVNLTSGMNANRADAINYVATQAAANPNRRYVINCSWKMNGDNAAVHNAIINAVNNNVVVVFAAGNANVDIDGATKQYPAVYSEVIAVAATDQSDRRAGFSNFGPKVDISAPGVNIYSTFMGDTYTFLNGTSMASPHVAGGAALVWSRNRSLTNSQVRNILETTADNIDPLNPGFAGKLGKGRLNLLRSMMSTPVPKLVSKVIQKYPFPQINNGSSTGLALVRPRLLFPLPIDLKATKPLPGLPVVPTPKLPLSPVFKTATLLFLTQQPYTEKIYFMNPTTGVVTGSVDPVNNDTIGTLEWDGRYIQVANVTTQSGSINAIDPITGAQVASLPVPAGRGEAMTIVGNEYHYSVINRVYRIRRTDGAVLGSYLPPGGSSYGMAYGDGLIFSSNANGEIVAYDPITLIVKGTLTGPNGTGASRAQALAYDSLLNRLYIADQSANTIYVLELSL